MLARAPDALDAMVGARIRIFRTHRGLSQSDLAGKIGVTFQQVQKYEKGANRAGASRLSRIAAALGISIGELFESSKDKPAKDKPADSQSPFRLLADPYALRVLKAFSRTSSPRLRRDIARLVESIADKRPAVKSSRRPAASKRGGRRRRTPTA